MDKQTFLNELDRLAGTLPVMDRGKLIEYYAEMIDDRMEDGLSEAEAVAMMGDPADLARELTDGVSRQAAVREDAASESVSALNGLRIRVANADVILLREAPADGAAAQLRFSDPQRFTWCMDGDVMQIVEREPEGAMFSLRRIVDLLASPGPRVTVALAGDLDGTLEFASGGGDLRSDGVAFGAARLHSASGDIELKSLACADALEIDVRSGDVDLDTVSAGGLRIKSASGDISATGVTAAGDLRLETASGDIDIRDVKGECLALSTLSGDIGVDRGAVGATSVHSASGDVQLKRLETDPTLSVDTASGDIDLRRCIARQTRLKSASGDVTVRLEPLPCGYDITARTVSGSCRFDDGAPERADGPRPQIAVNTASGDIDIRPIG